MDIWVPTKQEIESMLSDLLAKLRWAKSVSEVAKWADDMLSDLECHIANRANEESKIRIMEVACHLGDADALEVKVEDLK